MADGTHIEWTGATWNPITGCMIKSPGCINCYAMKLAAGRLQHHSSRAGLTHEVNGNHVWTGEVRFNEQWLDQPLRWTRPRDIFVVAHGDLFYEAVEMVHQSHIFHVIMTADHHRYQILTKRPEIAIQRLRKLGVTPKPHIWIGTSVERQQEADERRPHLETLAKAGWNTWVSYEPTLGQVDWSGWEFIRWLVSGGESGPKARPSHPDWHRAARDWCSANQIPYFFKHHGNWVSCLDREKDDPDWQQDYTIFERRHEYQFLNLAGGCGFHGSRLQVMRRTSKVIAGAHLDGFLHREMPDALKVAGALLDGREWREFPHSPISPAVDAAPEGE